MKIQDIIDKFDKEFVIHFPGDYNYGDPIEPYDRLRKQDPDQYIEFLQSSLTSLLDSIEKEAKDKIYSNKDLLLKSGTNDYYWMKSKNDTIDEVINIINSHK